MSYPSLEIFLLSCLLFSLTARVWLDSTQSWESLILQYQMQFNPILSPVDDNYEFFVEFFNSWMFQKWEIRLKTIDVAFCVA